MNRFLLLALCHLILLSCQMSVGQEKKHPDTTNSDKEVSLSSRYTNQFLLEAYLSMTSKKKIFFNGEEREYIDIEYIDSIKTNAGEVKKIPKEKIEILEKWCNNYVYIETKLTNSSPDLYLENFVLVYLKNSPFKKKYLLDGQTTESLSFSQSEMILLDFINYITLEDSTVSKKVLRDFDKFCSK